MRILGLHLVDVAVVLLYVAGIVWVGVRLQRRLKDTQDFYLGGRRLGRFYQFFLNFGTATDASQASTVSREIYRQGIGGMWLQYLVIWLTPFYWFTSMLLRRVRLVTVGDFFTDRYDSKRLAGAYAAFMLLMGVLGSGGGFLVAGKMMEAITPIPYERLDDDKKAVVDDYREYQELLSRRDAGLSAEEEERYQELSNRAKKKELVAFYSYVPRLIFYVIYGVIVAVYTMLGGFTAAAITDAIQGMLIIMFSMIMIPFALVKIGGFTGLHATVPDYMFHLFGTEVTSEYTWYMVAAMSFANLVSIIAVTHGMGISGSARTEATARFGVLAGMFFKRIVMIGWALIGILAFALFAGKLHDPDLAWGHATNELLSFLPGLIGLMLVGILAANMSSLDTSSVCNSALFIKNVYEPLRPGQDDRHYMGVGRVVIAVLLMGGIAAAYLKDDLAVLFKYFISLPAIFGGAIWLGFMWRRVTRLAVGIQVAICLLLYAVIPTTFPMIPGIARSETFLAETERREVTIQTGALKEDVDAGRAIKVGQIVEKQKIVDPQPIYFTRIVTVTVDGEEVRTGTERFNAEVWVLSLLGMDFSKASRADLETTRFLFAALAPFVLLVVLSLVTPRLRRETLDRFFAKMHTPTKPWPKEDREALEEAWANPEKVQARKLFGPESSWEFGRPGWLDAAGFFGSWVVVGLIIALLWIVTRFGTPGFETGAGVAGVVGILAAIGAILGAITSRGRGAP
ncbi:MAG: sodium:solute symporter family protein [Planctomycetota bacterium]